MVLLNKCAIRENAHDKVFGYLGRVKHLKKEKPELMIAIGGCMPQQESVIHNILEKHPYVDIVFGTHNIHELSKLILNHQKKQEIVWKEMYMKMFCINVILPLQHGLILCMAVINFVLIALFLTQEENKEVEKWKIF